MRKVRQQFWVDVALFAFLVLLVGTGALMKWVLPRGSGESLAVWGLGRHDWGLVHFVVACCLVGAFLLHLLLHWPWIKASVRGGTGSRRPGLRVGAGIAVVAVLLAAAAAPILSPVASTGAAAGGEGGRGEGRGAAVGVPLPPLHGGAPAESVRAIAPAPERGVCSAAPEVHGYMSLDSAARATGVPVEHLARQLRLPLDVPRTTPLRDVGRSHGFNMDDVRRIVREYPARC